MMRKKHKENQKRNAAYDDFASIMDEGKSSKVKPYIIAILVIFAISGGILYFVSRSLNGGSSVAFTTASNKPQVNEEAAQAAGLSACLNTTKTSNPTPDASDGDFYPKLLSSYDAMLACYDKYPNASTANYRSSVEYARQSAIDSSGGYKETYLASNSYQYTPQTSSGSGASSPQQPKKSSGTNQPSETTSSPSQPSEWTLNQEEFDKVVACADRAFASNPTQGAYGSPSYYEQKIAQLRAQLACTDGAKYSLSLQRRAQYQSDISTNQARYEDSLNPSSPSYYGNR